MSRADLSRPTVWFGFTAFGALLVAAFAGATISAVLAAICAVFGIILLLCKYHRKAPEYLIMAFTAAAFLLYYALCCFNTVAPYEKYAGEELTIHGEILSLPEKSNGKFFYRVRVSEFEETDEATDFTVRLSHSSSLNADIGDTVRCTVKFFEYRDTYGLSAKNSRLADGVVLGAYVSDYESVFTEKCEAKSIAYYIAAVRTYLNERIASVFPKDEASVLSAMLLGLRDSTTDKVESDYKGAGATHILVISGMHMTIVAQFALAVFQRLGIRRKFAAALSMIVIFAFVAISGFSSSALRSGIMQMLVLLGIFIGRNPDSLNSLAIAAAILLIFRPFWIGDVSFLLSFTSSLGIITLNQRLLNTFVMRITDKKRRAIATRLLSPITCSIAAILGSLPVQLYFFGTINLTSVITSLLIMQISTWIIQLGLPTVILLGAPILSRFALPFTLLTGILLKLQNLITAFVADTLPSSIRLSGEYMKGTVLTVVLFLLIAKALSKGGLKLPVFAMSGAILIFAVCAEAVLTYDTYRLVVLNNDYSSCTAVVHNGHATVLSCDGNGANAASFLNSHDIKQIDLLSVGNSESEIRCAQTLCEGFSVEELILPDSVYFPTDSVTHIYHYGTTLNADDFVVELSSYGDYAKMTLGNTEIIFEKNNAAYNHQICDILVTDSVESRIDGRFTILNTDMSMISAAPRLKNGQYLFMSEHETACVVMEADGGYLPQKN